ncbi:MAG: histidine kinase dimerization/phospho-acceptor domain-containing protein [Pseudomonadota bacterium]
MFENKPELLWRRYVLAIVLIACTITASHFLATRSSGDSARLAADVNLSGRQRMLSQRITLFAQSYVNAQDREVAETYRKTLVADLALFTESHQTLRSRPYLSPRHQTLYFGTNENSGLDKMVMQFQDLTEALLASRIAGKDETTLVSLNALKTLATAPLLTQLNEAVSEFEAIAKSVEEQETRLSHIIFMVALTLLILEAIFIFWPAHQAITAAVSGLRREKAAANSHKEAALEAALIAKQSLASKTRFFNILSHELRTPLNGIVAGTEILKDSDLLTDEDRETVAMIAASGDDLTQKITRLLDVSASIETAELDKNTPLDEQVLFSRTSYYEVDEN